LLCLVASCENPIRRKKANKENIEVIDLDSIRRRGSLIILTENSASTYFLYRNQASGFDYELALAFAKHLGVRLEVKLIDDVDRMFEMLRKGEADLVASNLTITPQRSDTVSFTQPLYQTRQVLVQRKIDRGEGLGSLAITDSSQLGSMPIWVHRYSSFYERLNEITASTGQAIQIKEAPGEISTDDLIRLVDDGAIPATITDENLASIELSNYDNIDASVAISGMQDIAWAVRKESTSLLAALNG
jgi:membrane-bound lytic murein transglycosylase F